MVTPLILSGPSGVGKTYLEKYLIQNHNFQRILSTTTRARRVNEVSGLDYEFIEEAEFLHRRKNNQFVTSLRNINAYYGVPIGLAEKISEQGKTPICVLVPQVIESFTSFYPHTNAIFLKPESTDLVIKRMRSRGDSEQQINERLKHTLSEIALYEQVKHLYRTAFTVTESNFNELVTAVLKINNPNSD